jgi:hypothetical protein
VLKKTWPSGWAIGGGGGVTKDCWSWPQIQEGVGGKKDLLKDLAKQFVGQMDIKIVEG